MKVPVEIGHIEHQVYGGTITTRIDIDELVSGVSLTTYYPERENAWFGVEERFSIFIEKGKIIFQRKKLTPRYDENGSPWDKNGKVFEPIETITNEVLKDYTVGK